MPEKVPAGQKHRKPSTHREKITPKPPSPTPKGHSLDKMTSATRLFSGGAYIPRVPEVPVHPDKHTPSAPGWHLTTLSPFKYKISEKCYDASYACSDTRCTWYLRDHLCPRSESRRTQRVHTVDELPATQPYKAKKKTRFRTKPNRPCVTLRTPRKDKRERKSRLSTYLAGKGSTISPGPCVPP